MPSRLIPKTPIKVLLLGIFISLLIYLVVDLGEKRNLENKFRLEAEAKIHLIENNLSNIQHILNSLKSFYDASKHINKSGFETFTKNQVKQYTYIKALEWIPKVEHKEKSQYEKQAAKNYSVSNIIFTQKNKYNELSPVKYRPRYFPVYYVNPYLGNELALGFDLSSEKSRNDSLMLAAKSGNMAITKVINLVQSDNTRKTAILALLPIFNNPNDVVADSNLNNLKGFVLSVVDMTTFTQQLLISEDYLELEFAIFDISDDLDKPQIISHHGLKKENLSLEKYSELYIDKELLIGSRNWLIRISGKGYFNSNHNHISLMVLLFGLILTCVASLYLKELSKRK